MSEVDDKGNAVPSADAAEGAHRAASLDTVERLGSWRTNAKYRIGETQRLTGVSRDSIKRWLQDYPGYILDLKPPWKDGMGRPWTNLTRLSFLEFVEILIAGKIKAGRYRDYRQVRQFHDSLAVESGTQFPFAHRILLDYKEKLHEQAVKTLEQMGIDYEVRVMSAHRTPERVAEYAQQARDRGIQVLIAAAGGSAALGGALAAWSTLPVIGIPLGSSDLKGIDALLSTAQMPPGIPVAAMAVGAWGARNAAFFAAQILGLQHPEIRQAYDDYRRELRER